MSKTLYIHAEAPEEIKENVRLSQQCLDNMVSYKEKADNGTLTFADLENMVQKNHSIIDQFPKGNSAAAGLPDKVDGTKGLLALAVSRQVELKSLSAKNPPVHNVGSIKDLHALCQKSPEEIGDTFIEAAKRKAEEEKASKTASAPVDGITVKTPKKLKISKLDRKLFHKHLEKTMELLEACKHCFYNSQVRWETIRHLEPQLKVHVECLEEHGQPAIDFLETYITEETDDEDYEEKRPAAAYLMASIRDSDEKSVKRLMELFRENEDLVPLIRPAVNYSLNSDLDRELNKNPELEPPHVQKSIVEMNQYKGLNKADSIPTLRESKLSLIQSSILKADVLEGHKIEMNKVQTLISEEPDLSETLTFVSLVARQEDGIWHCRKMLNEKAEEEINYPVLLSYTGDMRDYSLISNSLKKDESKKSAIQALGILGLKDCVHALLNLMKNEEWQIQKSIVESLELVTGAELHIPPPDIKEGPEGKEYEVEVVTQWYDIWKTWWVENNGLFDDDVRYRRGKRFHLGSCIEEMAYQLGNHWSRQGAYYELRIRSGEFVIHFEADWYVDDQLVAINKWQDWWQENQHNFGKSQWLFAGKEL